MSEAEREILSWGALLLAAFLTVCAIIDVIERAKPVMIVVEYAPPPSMVTQLLQEAQEITRRAATEADADDAE